MVLLLSVIFGCTNQIELVYTAEACVDWDFSNEEPELRIEVEGDDVVLRRVGVSGYCGDQFQPEILANGWDVRVIEDWDISDTTDCQSCLSARVTMISPPSGEYHIEWLAGGDEPLTVHDELFVVE